VKRRAAVTALAAVALLGAGCNDSVVPSGPSQPARAPRPPADRIDAMFTAWLQDIDSVPYPEWKVA
jgi:hypothetical protein